MLLHYSTLHMIQENGLSDLVSLGAKRNNKRGAFLYSRTARQQEMASFVKKHTSTNKLQLKRILNLTCFSLCFLREEPLFLKRTWRGDRSREQNWKRRVEKKSRQAFEKKVQIKVESKKAKAKYGVLARPCRPLCV